MHFLHPGLLGLAALAFPMLLLFLVRRRPKRVRVSTLAFFKTLSRVYQEAPWLRRLKKYLALALALATLLFAVGALAHLIVAPATGDLRSVLIVMDGSASMGTVDEDGNTRLEEAKVRVRERLAGLPSGVGVLLMRYDRRPEILLPHSYDRRALERALDGVSVRPIEGDPETSLLLARRLAALHAPAAVWHVTDGSPGPERTQVTKLSTGGDAPAARASDHEPEPSGDISFETIDVGLASPVNVGITRFQLRPRPLERGHYDAFIQLDASGERPIETQLEVRLGGQLVSLRAVTLRPGEPERLLLPVEGLHGATLTLEALAEGDTLPTDNRIVARIPQMQPIRLLWVRESACADPFTSLALSALGEEGVLEAYEATPSAYASLARDYDVLLLDGWLPDAWPEDTPVLVMKPPHSLGPVRSAPIAGLGLPIDSLRAIDETHPVLYGVASQRVALTQTAVLEASGSLTPLWIGEMGPMLVAGEVRGQKLVVMAFAADRSERLGMMASYPLLLGNAIFWLTSGDAETRAGNNLRTGSLVDTSGAALVWENQSHATRARKKGDRRSTVALLDRQGLWRVGEKSGSASLLSRGETLLESGPRAGARAELTGAGGLLRGDLRSLLLWLACSFLVLEAWLFHRHAVH